jgi:hypothetical protein
MHMVVPQVEGKLIDFYVSTPYQLVIEPTLPSTMCDFV